LSISLSEHKWQTVLKQHKRNTKRFGYTEYSACVREDESGNYYIDNVLKNEGLGEQLPFVNSSVVALFYHRDGENIDMQRLSPKTKIAPEVIEKITKLNLPVILGCSRGIKIMDSRFKYCCKFKVWFDD